MPDPSGISDISLRGKCALITGSTQGLGLAAAKQFAEAGCHVVLNGYADTDAIAAIRTGIERQHGVRTLYCGADLRIPGEIENMMSTALEAFGSVDVLVNNAVVRHAAPVEAFAAERWDDAIAVNLSAAFHTIRLALPAMRTRNWGRIINVSSIYGLRGAPNRIGYVTTKTALIGLTRAVALETLGQNITCNAVCPGTAETPVHEAAVRDMMAAGALTREDAEQRFLSGKQPTGRFITAESVAALMVFLCGPSSRDITGAALPIDGGWSSS
jgi:3-hydroxybutyrate dehydrogenase